MKKIIFLALLLTLISCHSSKDLIGYSTALVSNEKVIKINTSGFSDRENKIAYSTSTIQPIGSVSKIFVGISLMIAQQKGLIDLDADINDYLDFDVHNPKITDRNTITIRHLATHTSGIIDNEKIYESSYHEGKVPNQTLGAYLKSVLNKNGEKYSTKSFSDAKSSGKRYEYSNIGTALAAYIVEKVSKQSFSSFTKEHIFKPLKMDDTGWFYSDIKVSNHAILYDEKSKKLNPYTCVNYPDGSLKTNINDLALFLIELIKGYNGESDLLSKDSWNEFYKKNFSENSVVKNIPSKEPNTGILVAYFNSGKIGHTGSDLGVSCVMMFNPKSNTGQLFMANEDLTEKNIGKFKSIWNKLKKE